MRKVHFSYDHDETAFMEFYIIFMFSERGYSKLKHNYFPKKHTLLPLEECPIN